MPEEKEKCFLFTIESVNANHGYVYARDIDEARKKIEDEEWYDIDDSEILSFESITNIEKQ